MWHSTFGLIYSSLYTKLNNSQLQMFLLGSAMDHPTDSGVAQSLTHLQNDSVLGLSSWNSVHIYEPLRKVLENIILIFFLYFCCTRFMLKWFHTSLS